MYRPKMHISKWILIVSSAILIAVRLLEFVCNIEFKSEVSTLLVIAVLSAQNNTAARYSIRNTWKTLTNKRNMKFFFLVGKDFCLIHPEDRKSQLSCEALELFPTIGKENINILWTPSFLENNQKSSMSTITSFTFHINFPVIIRGIRLWKGALQDLSTSVVNLKNARTGSSISSVSFPASTSLSGGNDIWIEAEFNPFLLPKSFDAELQLLSEVAQNVTINDRVVVPCYGLSSWPNFNGGIEFTTQFKLDTGWSTFDAKSCSPVSILLELYDVETFLNERHSRSSEWHEQILMLSESLRNESYVEKDILFVNVLDVYRNIPDKLLQSYEWIYNNLNFSFLLKTDDDTFLNIPLIEQYFKFLTMTEEELSSSSRMWWWGKLRYGLPVERHGKWQELDYAAPIYPPFPCGGGYILNRNVIKFLVTNARWLHSFQGEDTSLGIWLSGVHLETPRNGTCYWMCANECDPHSCNRGQLSAEDMLSTWQQFQRTDTLC